MNPKPTMPGGNVRRDRHDLGLEVRTLAEVAGVNAEKLEAYEAGTYNPSQGMQREVAMALYAIEGLRTSDANFSEATLLRELVRKAYAGNFGGYRRDPVEWKKSFEEMKAHQEASEEYVDFWVGIRHGATGE